MNADLVSLMQLSTHVNPNVKWEIQISDYHQMNESSATGSIMKINLPLELIVNVNFYNYFHNTTIM